MKRTLSLNTMQGKFFCIFIMAIFAIINVKAAGLSGKYTIDKTKAPTATNYISFNDADSDLLTGSRASGGTANGPGVISAVEFDIANGLYNETVDITAISGASAKNTITFRSAGKDSSKVILMDSTVGGSYSTPGFVLHIDNSSFLIFKQITIMRGYNSSIPSYSYDHVVIIDNISDSDSIVGCQILGDFATHPNNYGALVFSGYSGSYTIDQYDVFKGNNMKGGYYGIYLLGDFTSGGAEAGNVISGNVMDSVGYYGIFLEVEDGVTISNNKINMPYGFYGIYTFYLGYSYYGANNRNIIDNNFVSVGNSGSPYENAGMMVYYSDLTDIVYNNINIYASASQTYAAYVYYYTTTKSMNLYNNNFVNGNSGSSDYVLYGNYISNEDYDNLFGGGTLVNYSYTNYTDLKSWKASSTGFAKQDVSVSPIYVSNSDLHVNNPAINGAAKTISNVKYDIDGDARNSTTPDIGADEFTPPAINPVIVSITNPVSGFCAGNQDIYITIGNYGLDTLKSLTIDWSVNGTAQTPYHWTGALTSTSTSNIKIGTFNFSSATAVYTVVANPDSANKTAITVTARNTQTVDVRAGLKGTFLIDNSGVGTPDYISFRAAASDLNLKGACGAVTFNVANGYYNESIIIGHIPNASATNPVLFQSKSNDSTKVILDTSWASTSSYPGAPLSFNGANYVTFRNMTFSDSAAPTSYGYDCAVSMYGGCNHITVENSILLTSHATNNYGETVFDYYGSQDSFLVIHNNHITGGYYGIYMAGNYSSTENGQEISNNLIDSCYQYGIYINDITGINISKNKLILNGGYAGIMVYGNGNIYTDTFTMSNNFVSNNGGSGYAFYLSSTYPANIFYNSFLNNTASTTASLYGYNTKNGVSVYDNIFANAGGGYCMEAYSEGVTNMDYNNYYTTGSNLGTWYNTTVGSTITCAKLSNWRTTTSKDKNGVSGDPKFNNPSLGDLHYSSGSVTGLHVGKPLPEIKDDIDGALRDSISPNIGADETKQYQVDAAAVSIDSPSTGFCSGSKDIYVFLLNAGKDTMKSVNINWKVNGTSMTTIAWTGVLSKLTGTLVKLGSITYSAGTNETIKVWTDSPNGVTDPNTSNDTTLRVTGVGMNGIYTIGGLTPNFNTFRDAVNGLSVFGVCGSVTLNVRDGYYNESVHIPAIPGANAPGSIVFQSQSLDSNKVQLDTSSTGAYNNHAYTLQFDGANYISFRKMTITNYTPSSYGYTDVVNFTNKASHNILEGNIMMTNTTAYTNYGSVVSNSSGSLESHNIIRNNIMSGGLAAIYFDAPYATGTVPTEIGNIVKENQMDTNWEYAVFAEYQDSLCLLGNTIYEANCYEGIYLYSLGKKDSSFLINNFVTVAGTNCYYGLYSYNSMLLGVFANSFNATATSYALYFDGSVGGRVKLLDNCVVNDGTGVAIYGSLTSMGGTSNYNNLYSVSSDVGNWGGTSCPALSDWQSTTKKDKNSVSGDPAYYDVTVGDLHLTSSSTVVLGLGSVLADSRYDIDGQPRGSTPDIGADERLPDSNDIGASGIINPNSKTCGTNGTLVTVKVTNYGLKDQTSFKVNVDINAGTYTGSATFSGGTLRGTNSAAPHDTTVNVFVSGWNSSSGASAVVMAYTTLVTDKAHKNDTTTSTVTPIAAPVAKFILNTSGTGSNICSGNGIKVTDKSTVSSGTYFYRLVDSKGSPIDSSTSTSPTFTYNTAGSNYRLYQTVSNGTCSDTFSKSFNIVTGPKAYFSHTTPLCKGTAITYTDSSKWGTAVVNTYSWTLGNGSTSTTSTAKTTYYTSGAETVTLTVSDKNGCKDSTAKSISIDAVDASFTKGKPSANGTVGFNATTTTYSSYAWDFGDTSTGTGSSTSHKYNHDSKYYVTLTAKNTASGCTDTKKDSVTILITGIQEFTSKFGVNIYPNPFTDHTNISYTLDNSDQVQISVFDITGRSIATLVNTNETAGSHSVIFNPSNYSSTPAGIYIVSMKIGERVSEYRLVNLK